MEGSDATPLVESAEKVGESKDVLAKEFARLARFLDAFQLQRAEVYGNSWCKRGSAGIFANVARKFDRLGIAVSKNMRGFEFEFETVEDGVNVVDQVADLAVYAVKFLTYLEKNHSAEFRAWLKKEGLESIYDQNRSFSDSPAASPVRFESLLSSAYSSWTLVNGATKQYDARSYSFRTGLYEPNEELLRELIRVRPGAFWFYLPPDGTVRPERGLHRFEKIEVDDGK